MRLILETWRYVLNIIDKKYDTNMVSDEGDDDDFELWITTINQSIPWLSIGFYKHNCVIKSKRIMSIWLCAHLGGT